MKEPLSRLRDGDEAVPGSVEAAGISLLRGRARYTPPAARKARVRAALEARARASWAWRWRPLVVASVLLVVVAGSGVSFGRQWVGSGYHRLLGWIRPVPVAPSPASPAVSRAASIARTEPVGEAPATEPPAEAGPVAKRETRPARPAHRPATAVAPREEPPANASDEPTMVATAMHALRRDHDPAHAARLLDDYLARWPDGALVEEALALAIEAARARGDARATTLATDYLRRFPRGRFADAARRTLAEPVAP